MKDLPLGLFDAFSTEPRRYSATGEWAGFRATSSIFAEMKQNDLSKFVVRKHLDDAARESGVQNEQDEAMGVGVEVDEVAGGEAVETDSSSESEQPSASTSQTTPSKKKVAVLRRGQSDKRQFHPAWKIGRDWLKYDPGQGMWCALCHQFRQHPAVAGCKRKWNALASPTKVYKYRNVNNHADGNYHLAAIGLSKKLFSPVANLPIQLPAVKIAQAKALFRTALFMARRGMAHRQLRHLIELQKANGIVFDLGYQASYAPVLIHFLAEACHDHIRREWQRASAKTIMTDEVKIGDVQWLSTSARIFVDGKFKQVAISPTKFEGDERDASAVTSAVASAFAAHGISEWIDDKLVAVTVDGASVLLSGVIKEVQKKGGEILGFYCASHRTQRVDCDVTEVPKADRANEEAMKVRKLAKKLNAVLSKTVAFFSKSTKRWATLRKVAARLGYHIAHGPM